MCIRDRNKQIFSAYAEELPSTGLPANDSYRYYDPSYAYNVDEEQTYGSLSVAGYVGMTRFWDYYNVRVSMPKTASAWMQYQNSHSKDEHLDLMQQMMVKSATLEDDMDYFNLSVMFYNVPMSDGTKQAISYYFNRSTNDNMQSIKEQLQPLMNELAGMLARSTPTTNPNDLCAYVNWSGRVHKTDGTYYGADIIAKQPVTQGDGSFVSGGNIYFVSNGVARFIGPSGAINSNYPSYRVFAAADQARLVELLKQWKTLQDEYDYNLYGSKPTDGPTIGSTQEYAMPSPTPVG
jgi:hypothetical protein